MLQILECIPKSQLIYKVVMAESRQILIAEKQLHFEDLANSSIPRRMLQEHQCDSTWKGIITCFLSCLAGSALPPAPGTPFWLAGGSRLQPHDFSSAFHSLMHQHMHSLSLCLRLSCLPEPFKAIVRPHKPEMTAEQA